MIRTGLGYDIHRLKEGRRLVLGGETIPFEKGLHGHSDADVLLHAIIDAMLGAAAMGDIGQRFPDTDPAYKNADSRKLLRKTVLLIREKGFHTGNVDAVITAQRPRLQSFIPAMRKNIAADLEISVDSVSVKATTSEKIGTVGREEGISATAVCLLFSSDQKR